MYQLILPVRLACIFLNFFVLFLNSLIFLIPISDRQGSPGNLISIYHSEVKLKGRIEQNWIQPCLANNFFTTVSLYIPPSTCLQFRNLSGRVPLKGRSLLNHQFLSTRPWQYFGRTHRRVEVCLVPVSITTVCMRCARSASHGTAPSVSPPCAHRALHAATLLHLQTPQSASNLAVSILISPVQVQPQLHFLSEHK